MAADAAPARAFKQARAKRTYESLIAAAREQFSRGGFDATQTPDIAAAAGVSVGTFYRYFRDKREVFLEVTRRFFDDAAREVMAELVLERFVGQGRRSAIDECVRIVLAHTGRDPALAKVIYEMALRDEAVTELRRELEGEVHRQLTFIIEHVVPKQRAADPEALAWVLLTAGIEVGIAASGMRGQPPVEAARVRESLAALIAQALFGVS